MPLPPILKELVIRIHGITTCVEYDDYLALTLEHNCKFMDACTVVTDYATYARVAKIADPIRHCAVVATNAFTRNGAHFNKGLALEENFDWTLYLAEDYILIWDCDILFPSFVAGGLEPNTLYGPSCRRMYEPVYLPLPHVNKWRHLPKSRDLEIAGYFQLFRADSQPRPWYETDWTHAGGADSMFARRFEHTQRLDFEVLHLGPRDTNWFGRCSKRLDGQPVPCDSTMMEKFLSWKGWFRPKQDIDFNEKVSKQDINFKEKI